jgi:RNA polymerase-binding transcription factor
MTVNLASRKDELLELRARLTAAAEGVHMSEGDGSELNSSASDQHIADHASDTFERELDESLEENADHVVREIDLALRRIEEGTYGNCAVCGREIPEERLAAVPYATLCIEDKRRQERG